MALKNLFRTKTTAIVLAHFHKSVEELHRVCETHHNLADQHEADARDATARAASARSEANFAAEAIGRLEAVFGVPA